MAQLMDTIRQRRSIRHYENRDVPAEMIEQILEAVRWSPSWANTQCWEVILVRKPELKERLQGAMSKGNPATKALAEAPIVVCLCGKLNSSGFYKGEVTTKFGDWFMFDLGIATQSLCLAAHDLGLGTVVAGLFDHNQVKDILGVPEGYEPVVLLPLGFPAKSTSAPKRRETSEFRHDDTF